MSKNEVLWVITRKRLAESVQDLALHGRIYAEWRLPHATCPECGANILPGPPLPVQCPISLQTLIRETEKKWRFPRVPLAEWERLAIPWQRLMAEAGYEGKLLPGADFAPSTWHVPICPERRIYWADCINYYGIIMDATSVMRINAQTLTGIELYKIDRVQYYSRNERDAVKATRRSAEEYRLDRFCHSTYKEGDFWQTILSKYTYPDETESGVKLVRCKFCGHTVEELSDDYLSYRERLVFERHIPRRHVPSLDVFWSHVPGRMVITDRVYQLIGRDAFSALDAQEWTICD